MSECVGGSVSEVPTDDEVFGDSRATVDEEVYPGGSVGVAESEVADMDHGGARDRDRDRDR